MCRSLTTLAAFRSLLIGLGVLGLAARVHAGLPGPPFDPTHYWTYSEQIPMVAPSPIFARDQFFRNGVPLTVEKRERLLNWVSKNNSPVPDTLLHYTLWNILEKLPVNRQAIVTNQFGSFRVNVLNLEFMLAPAYKSASNPPVTLPAANHYLCYRTTGFPAPTASYDLRDEWRVDSQQPGVMEFLCAPCAKQHLGQTYAPVDTLLHLAAFLVYPVSEVFYPIIIDQFLPNQELVSQHGLEYLFVPSEKTDLPTDVKKNTWSRLKQLYR